MLGLAPATRLAVSDAAEEPDVSLCVPLDTVDE